jgi:type II secretory pathway pseudopilin PulG
MNNQSSLPSFWHALGFKCVELLGCKRGGKGGEAIWTRQCGFTLAEMAIVLVIAMLLLSGFLIPFGTQIQNKRIADTQKTLDEIREALVGYAIINKRLPRPTLTVTDGNEKVALCATAADCTGPIPWATLGINKLDAWGKVIWYSVHPAYTNPAPAITLTSTALPSSSYKFVNVRDSAGTVSSVNGIAFILVSFGTKNFGTSESGVTLANSSTTNADEQLNAAATGTSSNPFISRSVTDVPTAVGGEFDDFVVFVPNGTLVSRISTATGPLSP